MQAQIKVEHEATSRAFSRLQLQQYPYALAKALTMTAKDGQSAIRGRTKRVFKLHGQYTLRNLRIKPAKKIDVVSKRNAYSEVYTDERIVPYMPQHEPGSIKTAKKGRLVAVPMRDIKRKRYRTSGGVKKQYTPKFLMKQMKQGENARATGRRFAMHQAKGRSKRKLPFLIESKKGGPLLVKRKTIRGSSLEFLWAFVRRARIKPTWKFEQTIKSRVSRTFEKHFRQSMARAVQTAR